MASLPLLSRFSGESWKLAVAVGATLVSKPVVSVCKRISIAFDGWLQQGGFPAVLGAPLNAESREWLRLKSPQAFLQVPWPLVGQGWPRHEDEDGY